MTFSIRPATPDDTDLILDLVDMASNGVVPAIWQGFAPEGMTGRDVGRAMALADDGPFSHSRAWVLEADGTAAAGMIGFPMTEADAATEPGLPDAFQPVKALEARALGSWYINVIATMPVYRGQGCAAALLEAAEAEARAAGCPGLSLIVAASNTGAIRLYRRFGFAEVARRPFDVTAFDRPATDAVLMLKPV